jgi:hypothetical protein
MPTVRQQSTEVNQHSSLPARVHADLRKFAHAEEGVMEKVVN